MSLLHGRGAGRRLHDRVSKYVTPHSPMHHRDWKSSGLRKRVLLDKKKKKDGNRANFSRGWQATPFLPGEVMIDVLTPGCVSAGLGQASGRSGDLACLRCVCGSGGGGVRGLYDTEA